MERAIELKEKGNQYYKEKNYECAVSEYTAAIQEYKDPVFFLNRASALLCLKKYNLVFDDCFSYFTYRDTKINSLTAKALFRIANALQLSDDQNWIFKSDSVIEFLLLTSLQEEQSNLAKVNFQDHLKEKLVKKTKEIQNFNLFSSYSSTISRNKINSNQINTYWKEIKTKEEKYPIEINQISNFCFSFYGNHIKTILSIISSPSISSFGKFHFIENSLNRLIRSIIFIYILTNYNTELYDLNFILCLFYDSFISKKHCEILHAIFDELLNKIQKKENFSQFENIFLYNSSSNDLNSLFQLVILFFKSLLNSNCFEYLKKQREDQINQKNLNLSSEIDLFWFQNGFLFNNDNGHCNYPNPFMFDPISLSCLDLSGPKSNFSEISSFQEEIINYWDPLLHIFKEKQEKFKKYKFCFWFGDALSILLHEIPSLKIQFNWIESFNGIDHCGLWNLIPICKSLLSDNPKGILQTNTKYGNPINYKKLISPMYCKEDEVDEFLSIVLGFLPKTIQVNKNPNELFIHWMKLSSKNKNSLDHQTSIAIKNLSRFLMRISVSIIQPYSDDNHQDLFECGYQYPFHTIFSFLLCAKYANDVYPGCIKHLIDVALLSDQLAGRPFIKHRRLLLRMMASLNMDYLLNSFLSIDLFIPKNLFAFTFVNVSPIKGKQFNEPGFVFRSKSNLLLLLFSSKNLADDAFNSQNNNKDKSNLFLWCMSKDENQLQLIDNVEYFPEAKCLYFLFPKDDFMAETLNYGFLIDLNTYYALTKPFTIS